MKTKLLIFLIVCVLLGGYGITARAKHADDLKHETAEGSISTVAVVHPEAGKGTDEIVLPGQLEAWHAAPIYARTNGYIAKWNTDIGAHVKKGAVLAEIDTPEVDAQYQQAQADLATAVANKKLSDQTLDRWQSLVKSDSVTKQETDEKIGDAAAKASAVAAAQANVNRLQDLETFKKVVAPFDGVISVRNIDTGTLVNATNGAQGQELFHIVEKDKLRVYVDVPEIYTQRLTDGMTVELHLAEYPGQVFPAAMDTDASALNAATRTLRVELTVDNADEKLLPGSYVEAHIKVTSNGDGLKLPVNTFLYRPNGVFVATVGEDGRVHLKTVTMGRDFGAAVEVTTGVDEKDQVIVNPVDSIAENEQVKIAAPPAAAAADAKDGKK